MKLALKVDVDTWRGTRDGVPRLVELLGATAPAPPSCSASAPTTPAGRCAACSGRASLQSAAHLGVCALRPAHAALRHAAARPRHRPARRADACARCAPPASRCGVHCWDHVRWQDGVASADADWTEREMRRARERFDLDLRPGAEHLGRGRLADQPARAAWSRSRTSTMRPIRRGRGPFRPLVGRRAAGLPAAADHAADAGRADRPRRHRRRQRRRAPARPHRAAAPACLHRACRARRRRAAGLLRGAAARLEGAGLRAGCACARCSSRSTWRSFPGTTWSTAKFRAARARSRSRHERAAAAVPAVVPPADRLRCRRAGAAARRAEIVYEVQRNGSAMAEITALLEQADGRYKLAEKWQGRGIYALLGKATRISIGSLGANSVRPANSPTSAAAATPRAPRSTGRPAR